MPLHSLPIRGELWHEADLTPILLILRLKKNPWELAPGDLYVSGYVYCNIFVVGIDRDMRCGNNENYQKKVPAYASFITLFHNDPGK